MKDKLTKLICNSVFEDNDGNIYEFKCFPNSQNLMVNGKQIGDFEISEDSKSMKIIFEGSFYEILEIGDDKLKLKQDSLIFEIEKNK